MYEPIQPLSPWMVVGGEKGIFNCIFFGGINVPSRPLAMLGQVAPIGPLSQSHYWCHILLSGRDPTLPVSIPLS